MTNDNWLWFFVGAGVVFGLRLILGVLHWLIDTANSQFGGWDR